MRDAAATLIGKTIKALLFFRRGGGQTLPGLVVEKLFPGYLPAMLAKLPDGVVIITGTNGKTTTTKIVTQLLAENGKKILTNSTGSNLIRGITSSVVRRASLSGGLPADIAVLEVDEATARALVNIVRPRWVLALNVSRDQLDRYGEVDTIAGYVLAALNIATEGVVINADDPHLLAAAETLDAAYFGTSDSLRRYFPSDFELAAVDSKSNRKSKKPLDVELTDFNGRRVSYRIGGRKYETKLKLSGQHNYLNGAAALALCRKLLPEADTQALVEELSEVELAFGRGEVYRYGGSEIELVLIKNPASFTQALASYGSTEHELMIAINDNIADGRDVSWLWDVNLEPLTARQISMTSGSRAADMALRLSYDGIKTSQVVPNLDKALSQLSAGGGRKVILSTYTAMLKLYSRLSKDGEKIA